MRCRGLAVFAIGLAVVGCSGVGSQEPSELLGEHEALLTATDVDVAPECQGIIDFVNVASSQTLRTYLPNDVVSNIVGSRATSPFVTLADVSSVPLVIAARLDQIEAGARGEGYINATCAGIMDELALSAEEASRMVSLVNNASPAQLHEILPDAWNGATNLIEQRPFVSVENISATSGIGPVSLWRIRNAATMVAAN